MRFVNSNIYFKMGLDVYIITDLSERFVPKKYQQLIDFGIKGWWLVPYVRTFGVFEEGIGTISVTNYLKYHMPSWETVEEYLKGEYPNNYSKVWSKDDHETFINALVYFANNDYDSWLQYDY